MGSLGFKIVEGNKVEATSNKIGAAIRKAKTASRTRYPTMRVCANPST
jgi:hypothetical protein